MGFTNANIINMKQIAMFVKKTIFTCVNEYANGFRWVWGSFDVFHKFLKIYEELRYEIKHLDSHH